MRFPEAPLLWFASLPGKRGHPEALCWKPSDGRKWGAAWCQACSPLPLPLRCAWPVKSSERRVGSCGLWACSGFQVSYLPALPLHVLALPLTSPLTPWVTQLQPLCLLHLCTQPAEAVGVGEHLAASLAGSMGGLRKPPARLHRAPDKAGFPEDCHTECLFPSRTATQTAWARRAHCTQHGQLAPFNYRQN